jgi:hypothetical protein
MNVYSKLPRELRYLIGPAEKYGNYSSDILIGKFLDQATETELAELSAIAERYRLNKHAKILGKFLDEYTTQHDQSFRLYNLLAVIDAAGFDVYESNLDSVDYQIELLQEFGSYRLASGRMFAARFLADLGDGAAKAIPLLWIACSDEDERVQVWAHYALAKLEGNRDVHVDAIRKIFFAHDELDDLDMYDEVGSEAEEALQLLSSVGP